MYELAEEVKVSLTRIVGTADGDNTTQLVLNSDALNTSDTEGLVVSVGTVQLATLASDTTDGLASGTLSRGPLGFQVTRRALVRAHGTFSAALSTDGSDNRVHQGSQRVHSWVLDTAPSSDVEVVKSDSTVFRWESIARKLSVGERSSNTSATAVA